jgi:hypothetical protein
MVSADGAEKTMQPVVTADVADILSDNSASPTASGGGNVRRTVTNRSHDSGGARNWPVEQVNPGQ